MLWTLSKSISTIAMVFLALTKRLYKLLEAKVSKGDFKLLHTLQINQKPNVQQNPKHEKTY